MAHVVEKTIVTVPGLEQQRLGINTACGDPNSTEPRTDTVKQALPFKSESVVATEQERSDALKLLRQLYPQEF
jgi:hypothetical protein